MGTAYIDTTITAVEGGVTLFQIECTAEIEYTTDCGDLCDWHIRDFSFTESKGHWNSRKNVWEYVAVASTWCPDDLRPVLRRYANQTAIEEALFEQLRVAGEVTYANEGLRADYHAAVL